MHIQEKILQHTLSFERNPENLVVESSTLEVAYLEVFILVLTTQVELQHNIVRI